jgi:hypothetical protein
MTTSSKATPGSRSGLSWSTWPNWINIGLGLYLALSPLWIGIVDRAAWFTILGVLIVLVGLWGVKTGSSALSQWVQIVMGILTFVAPWMVFRVPWVPAAATTAGTDWTAWIIGVLVIAFAIIGMAQGKASARA